MLWGVVSICLLAAEPGAGPRRAPEAAGGPPASAAASVAYRDAATGRWTTPPAERDPEVLAAAWRRLAPAAAGELREEPTGSPAGGVRLSLGGRFRSLTVARREADGRVVVDCQTVSSPVEVPGRPDQGRP
jgi:hypothetical protein